MSKRSWMQVPRDSMTYLSQMREGLTASVGGRPSDVYPWESPRNCACRPNAIALDSRRSPAP